MYLDAKEVFRLSCNGDGGLERDSAVDIGHGGGANESIALPCSCSVPAEVIGILAVLHDGWDAVVVISGGVLSINSLLLGLVIVCKFFFCCTFL